MQPNVGDGFSGTTEAITFSTFGAGPGACNESGSAPGGFCQDVGIDYSELTGNLVTSDHFQTGGLPNNLDNVDRITGARSNAAPAYSGHPDELKVATARKVTGACSQNAPVGTIFTGTGVAGEVAMITPPGNTAANVTILPLPGEVALLRGGFNLIISA